MEFCVTQNETPEMGKSSNCTKKLSQNFTEHVRSKELLNNLIVILQYNLHFCIK